MTHGKPVDGQEEATFGPAAATLQAAVGIVRPSDQARALLKKAADPDAYFGQLAKSEFFSDGIGLLAFTLPVRFVVWWLCLATWRVLGKTLTPEEETAIVAAVHWLADPTEERRRVAEAIACDQDLRILPFRCAKAASLAGSGAAPEYRLDGAVPNSVAGLVLTGSNLVLTKSKGSKAPASARELFELGMHIRSGRLRWLA